MFDVLHVRPGIALWIAACVGCLGAASPASERENSVVVRIERDKASIENEFLTWETRLETGRTGSAVITNRRTGKATVFQGEDFRLEFADGRKITASEFSVEKVGQQQAAAHGRQLEILLRRGDDRLRLTTELKPGQWWARRWLSLEGREGRLEGVALALWNCEGARGQVKPGKIEPALGLPDGCGQPVYVDDLFLGIAHPAPRTS